MCCICGTHTRNTFLRPHTHANMQQINTVRARQQPFFVEDYTICTTKKHATMLACFFIALPVYTNSVGRVFVSVICTCICMRTGDLWVAIGERHVRYASTSATFRAAAPLIYMFEEYSIVDTDNHPLGFAVNQNSQRSRAHSALSLSLCGKLPTTENRSSGRRSRQRNGTTDRRRRRRRPSNFPRLCAPIGQCTLQSQHVRFVWRSVSERPSTRRPRSVFRVCRVFASSHRTENNTNKQR